jgi:RNA polymerase sigma-70 factor (ECF subfamily)
VTDQNQEVGQVCGSEAAFTVTRWTMVVLAGQNNSPQADAALADLCRKYWSPLYFYVRRLGHSPDDAQDLVQGFFARLLEKNYLRDADRNKGRFRSFLLVALKGYMANEWDRINREKRGGGQPLLSIDEENTETRYRTEPVDQITPEKAYERQWVVSLLERVMGLLEEECKISGKTVLFQELKGSLIGDSNGPSYVQIGQKLGLTEANVKVTVHRLRRRYGTLLRNEIAETVDCPEAVDDELRHLFVALT